MSKLNIAIACGGTGGHLFPGIAVSNELQARGHDTLLLVSSKQIDAVALQGTNQRSEALVSMGFPGMSPKLVQFCLTLWKSYRQCQNIFDDFQPHAVLGMGGFTSASPLWAGRKRKIPTFIHDSNAYPGRVTRAISKHVTKVLLGFEDTRAHLPGADCIVTGTPVRQGLERKDRAEAAAKFGLDPAKRIIMVMGGSQGAMGINKALDQMLGLAQAHKDDWQFVHLTGPGNEGPVEESYQKHGFTAKVLPFCSEMEYLYSVADLIIARSGASSLNETAHYGIPSILVPYPYAADDHQRLNALIFERVGAAHMYAEDKLNPETLVKVIEEIFAEPETHRLMCEAARQLAGTNAAKAVADVIEEACSRK